MKKILITGSTGLIGSRVVEMFSYKYEFIPLLSSELDLKDKEATSYKLQATDFDLLLHLAAYTNVDKAEEEPDVARELNVSATQNLVDIVEGKGAQMIHISTDFVFDGQNQGIYVETSPTQAISVYGQTKLEAEEVVRGKALIVRPSYPYRGEFEKKKDFVRTIKWLLEQKKEIKAVEDSLITPTFIDDIAFGLDELITNYELRIAKSPIYHLVGGDSLSPYDACRQIAKTFKLDLDLIQPTTYAAYFAGKAQRPQYSAVASIYNDFQIMKTFEEGLKQMRRLE